MHFTGRTWRPPYESQSVILQATSGCTHNKCTFCSLYKDEKFRMSPMDEFEEDPGVLTRKPKKKATPVRTPKTETRRPEAGTQKPSVPEPTVTDLFDDDIEFLDLNDL